MDGLETCRRLPAAGDLPFMFLSSRDDELDRVLGIELGADDYVVKPFSPRELVARIKVVLRRIGRGGGVKQRAPETGSYAFAGWVLKAGERGLVDPDGVQVPLSTGEFNLMLAFATHPHQVLSRDQLLDLAYGREAHAFDRAIDNHISRLRRKIEADPKSPALIKTVWGGGYTLSADVTRL
jgi:two-component system OmpR family response regulator